MFPSPILGKGSIGCPVQYWEKVLCSPNQYWDRFYRFPRPVLGKGSIVSQSSTGKSSRFPSLLLGIILDSPVHAVLGKGSVGSSVLYWEKDL